jgi:hypothetical protein
MDVRYCRLIKKKKSLVDVAPHWGEPRKSCVDGLLCAIMFMFFLSAMNVMNYRYIYE